VKFSVVDLRCSGRDGSDGQLVLLGVSACIFSCNYWASLYSHTQGSHGFGASLSFFGSVFMPPDR
jgi:hypothetical protein